MFDLQHVPNIKDGKRLIKGFYPTKSITIAIPSYEHGKIKFQDYSSIENPRILLSKEIRNLRRYTNIPPAILLKIIEANKKMYFESFKKVL